MTADDMTKRRRARIKEVFEDLNKIEDDIAAKGWPHYSDDPELWHGSVPGSLRRPGCLL